MSNGYSGSNGKVCGYDDKCGVVAIDGGATERSLFC